MATVTIVEETLLPASGTHRPKAVSWPAIFAGAIAAGALSLILLVLGMGLGLSAVSPWVNRGPSSEAITWGAIIWIAVAAFASSGLGGYIAGRLRENWPGVQRDEVYFRDTAHGFLAWALATLVTAVAFTAVTGAILGITDPAATEPARDAAVQVTDEARRNAATASLWIFVSLLIGAFSASLMATFGGRQRDLP